MSEDGVTRVLEAVRRLAPGGWLVGGSVRDRLLGRSTTDFDIAMAGDPREAARALARALAGHTFRLSDGFGGWRVVARDHSWQVDLLSLTGSTIEADLARRDFTVNAIAEPLSGGPPVDPFGGRRDLARRCLRMVSAQALEADALRVMRLPRLACELGFAIEPATREAARAAADGLRQVAPERVLTELRRVISADRAVAGLDAMAEVGALDVVLPELAALRGVEQSHYHHLDVYEHTRAVLAQAIELERDPEPWLGDRAPAVSEMMSAPLANELSRWQALRFGALLHDIAKPITRRITPEGRVTFLGHDARGAEVARDILGRLRSSERLREHVAALARNHLRLGFLVHRMPLDRRTVYRYLRDCEAVAVDVTLLSVADRLATRGSGAEPAIEKHLMLARELVSEALAWAAAPPRPPVRGDELVAALGISAGPELGRLLRELEEASFAGELASRDDALARARELLAAER